MDDNMVFVKVDGVWYTIDITDLNTNHPDLKLENTNIMSRSDDYVIKEHHHIVSNIIRKYQESIYDQIRSGANVIINSYQHYIKLQEITSRKVDAYAPEMVEIVKSTSTIGENFSQLAKDRYTIYKDFLTEINDKLKKIREMAYSIDISLNQDAAKC